MFGSLNYWSWLSEKFLSYSLEKMTGQEKRKWGRGQFGLSITIIP